MSDRYLAECLREVEYDPLNLSLGTVVAQRLVRHGYPEALSMLYAIQREATIAERQAAVAAYRAENSRVGRVIAFYQPPADWTPKEKHSVARSAHANANLSCFVEAETVDVGAVTYHKATGVPVLVTYMGARGPTNVGVNVQRVLFATREGAKGNCWRTDVALVLNPASRLYGLDPWTQCLTEEEAKKYE